MLWALLPVLFLSLILGFTAIEGDMATTKPPAAPFPMNASDAAAQEFMVYRNAVMNYAEQNQDTTGPVPLSSLTAYLPTARVSALPAAAQAVITPGQGNSSYVCVWMPVPAGAIGQVIDQTNGDLTIGTVMSSERWVQAAPGGSIQQIPCSLAGVTPPAPGYIMSVFGLGGS